MSLSFRNSTSWKRGELGTFISFARWIPYPNEWDMSSPKPEHHMKWMGKIFHNTTVLRFLEEYNVLFYKTVQQFLTISLRVLLYVVSNSLLSQVTLQEISHKFPDWPFSAKFNSNLVIRYVLWRLKNNKICFISIEGQSICLKPLANLMQFLIYSVLDIKYIGWFVINISIICK